MGFIIHKTALPCNLVHPANVPRDDGPAEELLAAQTANEAPPDVASSFYPAILSTICRLLWMLLLGAPFTYDVHRGLGRII